MKRLRWLVPAMGMLFLTGILASADDYGGERDRSKLPDSFKYYGPGGLWWRWDEAQKLGRDTWFFNTGGNQKFYRILAKFGSDLGISVDFYRVLDSRRRGERFQQLGLINEPNFVGNQQDEFGFWMDQKKQPFDPDYPVDPRWYGEPTGVVGLRKFPNPAFTEQMKTDWMKDKAGSVRKYFANPGKVEPPYIVGISCTLCHVAFDPLNPPKDVNNPRWENLAANMGNQYFREGDLFFGWGRVVGGDSNPGPKFADDPYDSKGLDASSFLYQYGHTQQPGTSETSRFSYDFINNPNTINQIFNIGNRAGFCETTPTGKQQITNHVLKDGADSIGIHGALLRVFINIGSEGDYWADHLWNPATGLSQRPFSINDVKLEVSDARRRELLSKYPELGEAWRENERRVPFLVSYLASYTPYKLADIKNTDGSPKYVSKDKDQLKRGALVYADRCAQCHSNKQPFYPLTSDADKTRYRRDLVLSDDFLSGNTLSDDVRYPFNFPGLEINAARAMATNAVDGDIWANFSSKDYKALPPLGVMSFSTPLNKLSPAFGGEPIVTEFDAPGGGRGYYRTAALNSMWSTAPFLHNNSVGKEPLDANGLIDGRFASIEGRLELFESAMDELLNPEKRPLKIKLTSADSALIGGMPAVRAKLASVLQDLARQETAGTLRKIVYDVVVKTDIDDAFKPAFKLVVEVIIKRLQPKIDALYTEQNLAKIKAAIIEAVRDEIDKTIADELKGKPLVAQLLEKLKPQIEAAFQKSAADLATLLRPDLTIPKGTPLNLLLNLHISKVPYALGVYLKYKDDPRTLAAELLKLSDCPDIVENHGHTFGSDLRPQEKRDLIEYLKTL